MDQNSWITHCIETSLDKLTLSTKCIKQSASFLLTMPEHSDLMSKSWLRAFQSALEPANQLALLYVVNEIILKCASYGEPDVKTAFQEPLMEAIKYLRPGLLIKKVKKLLTMWAERKVYEPKFTHQLLRATMNIDQNTGTFKEKRDGSDEAAIVKDFSTEVFVEELHNFKWVEDATPAYSEADLIPACFSLPIDVIINRMKNKEEGRSFARQVTNCAAQLDQALVEMNKKLIAQENLLRVVEKAELFYSVQQKEAVVVANAYKTYGERVQCTLNTVQGKPMSTAQPADEETANPADSPKASSNHDDDDDVVDMDNDDDDDDVDMDLAEDLPISAPKRPKPNPFGLSLDGSSLPLIESKASNEPQKPLIDLATFASYPFHEAIFVEKEHGDVDYRPMFQKICDEAKRLEDQKNHPLRPVDVDHRVNLQKQQSVWLNAEYTQSVMDKENTDKKLIKSSDGENKNSVQVDIPTESDKASFSALTATGDYDWRQSQQTASSASAEVAPQDSDLRFPLNNPPIPSSVNDIPANNSSIIQEVTKPLEDRDYRQFPALPQQIPIPATTSWMTNGDSDLRNQQPLPPVLTPAALVTAFAPTLNPLVTAQTILAANGIFPPSPTVVTSFGHLLPQLTANQLALLHQQQIRVPMFVPPIASQAPMQTLLQPISFSSAAPPPPPPPQTQGITNISADLLSSLRKINLPMPALSAAASVIQKSVVGSEQQTSVSVASKPNPLASFLKSIQSTNKTALATVTTTGFNSTNFPPHVTTSTPMITSASEDPFAIISRLTGLSNLMQSVRPVTKPSVKLAAASPKYSDESSEDESPKRLPLPVFSTHGSASQALNINPQPMATVNPSDNEKNNSSIAQQESSYDDADRDDDDGGATPTQDESEHVPQPQLIAPSSISIVTPVAASSSPFGFSFASTGNTSCLPPVSLESSSFPPFHSLAQGVGHLISPSHPQYPLSMGMQLSRFQSLIVSSSAGVHSTTPITVTPSLPSPWQQQINNNQIPQFIAGIPPPSDPSHSFFSLPGTQLHSHQLLNSFPNTSSLMEMHQARLNTSQPPSHP